MTQPWTQEQEDSVCNILMEMHVTKEVYVSNGVMGDIVTYNVCCRCQHEGAWDKDAIKRFIREDANFQPQHDDDADTLPEPGAIESIVAALTATSTRPTKE